MDAINQVAELIDAAEDKSFLGTILDIKAANVGPENALIAPVIPMVKKMSAATVQGFSDFKLELSERIIKKTIQQM